MLAKPIDLDGGIAPNVGKIKLKYIEPNPYQPRTSFDEEKLEELITSIKVHGVVQPITVRKVANNAYQIISGERRFRASKEADLADIPAYVIEANDQEMREIALIENVQRHDLNAVETALSYQALIDDVGLTHKELAERIGKSRASISNALRLLKLPPEIQEGIKRRLLSAGHARALCSIEGAPDAQLDIYHAIVSNKISVRETEKRVQAVNKDENKHEGVKSKSINKLSFAYQKIEDDLSRTFETKVQLKTKGKGGEIVIPYLSDEDLNRILEQLP
ncbi:UNVERIFIED_CONTAM: hypothetical protein GTU68_002060 [Idotea baltica]|nr:hypothetical protein [Idotea baltica]